MILHFALTPKIYSFGQNEMSVQFEGCVHVRVCMCVGVHIVENKLENTYLTFPPFLLEVEIKQIFGIVTFDYHRIVHRRQ